MGTGRRVFISYSRDDTAHAKALYGQLATLRNEHGGDVFWDQERIDAGEKWAEVLHDGIEQADVFVLLISASFLNSPFCRTQEARRAMERKRAGQAKVLWVYLSACDYARTKFESHPQAESLDQLQAAGPLNAQGRIDQPLVDVASRESAWRQVAVRVRRACGVKLPEDNGDGGATSDADDPTQVDVERLVAWCDRTDVLKALRRFHGDKQHGLLVLLGPSNDVSPVLFRRCREELQKYDQLSALVVHLMQRDLKSVGEYDDETCRCWESPTPDRPRSRAQWAAALNGYNLLLVTNFVNCDVGDLAALSEQMTLVSTWLHGLPELPCPVVAVLVMRHEAPVARGVLTRWFRKPRDSRSLVRDAFEAHARQKDRPASPPPSELVELRNYHIDEVRDWRQLPNVRPALQSRWLDVDEVIEDMAQQHVEPSFMMLKTRIGQILTSRTTEPS